jgi:hypothetical protein
MTTASVSPRFDQFEDVVRNVSADIVDRPSRRMRPDDRRLGVL